MNKHKTCTTAFLMLLLFVMTSSFSLAQKSSIFPHNLLVYPYKYREIEFTLFSYKYFKEDQSDNTFKVLTLEEDDRVEDRLKEMDVYKTLQYILLADLHGFEDYYQNPSLRNGENLLFTQELCNNDDSAFRVVMVQAVMAGSSDTLNYIPTVKPFDLAGKNDFYEGLNEETTKFGIRKIKCHPNSEDLISVVTLEN